VSVQYYPTLLVNFWLTSPPYSHFDCSGVENYSSLNTKYINIFWRHFSTSPLPPLSSLPLYAMRPFKRSRYAPPVRGSALRRPIMAGARRGKARSYPKRRTGVSSDFSRSQAITTGYLPGPGLATGFPDRLRCKLAYSETGVRSSAIPGTYTIGQRWRLGSLFDPDQTGTGSQPRFYDQLTPIYDKYRVDGAFVRLSVRQRAQHGITVILVPTSDVVPLNRYDAMEDPRASAALLTSDDQPPVVFEKYYSLAALNGVTPATYQADDIYNSFINNNPLKETVLHQTVFSTGQDTLVDYEFSIQITYYCEFFDRKVMTQS